MNLFYASFACLSVVSGAASAQDLTFSFGQTTMQAHEIVYKQNGHYLSLLNWRGSFPTVGAALVMPVGQFWRLTSSFQTATSGGLKMDDYDWLDFAPSAALDDWDHHSAHSVVPLSSYHKINLEMTRAIDPSLNGGFGIGYTTFTAAAYGGDFVYSDATLHDDVFSLGDDIKGVTYTQRMPTAYLVADGEVKLREDTDLIWSGRVGATVLPTSTDLHHLRGLRFEDRMRRAFYTSLSLGIRHQLPVGMLNATVEIDQHHVSTGIDKIYDMQTDELLYAGATGDVGASLRSSRISVRYSYTF